MVHIKNFLIVFAITLLLTANGAEASFLDSTVTLEGRYPNISSVDASFGSVTVGASVEFPSVYSWYSGGVLIGPAWTSDVGSTTISLTELADFNNLGGASFNGFFFQFANAPNINSVALNPSSTLSVTSLIFTSDSIAVNYAGTVINGPVTTVLDVTFVPEPATIWLFGSGLAVLGLIRRNRYSRIHAFREAHLNK